mgnify:FL=1
MKQWYAVRSKPKKETSSAELLAHAGIEVFVPQTRVQKQRGKPPILEPYFPGYFFSRLDASQGEIRLVSYTSGVLYIVGYDGQPWSVPDGVVSAIQERLAGLGCRPALIDLHAGDRVKITSGPLEDIEAIFDCYLSATGRIRVFIQMLERLCRAELLASQVRRISSVVRTP